MTPPQHTRTASHASDARPWRVALCVCVLLSAYASARAPHADASGAPRVRVKGSARVDAHASRERARVALSGSVLDDAGRPIPAARVTIGVTRAPDGAPATTAAPLALAVPDTCGGGAEARLERADRLVTSADETGRYCVRLELPAGRYVAHVEVPASPLVDGASADVAVDLSLAVTLVALRFDPARSTLSLDEPTALVDVVASSADEGVRAAAPGLPLALFGDSGALLGNAATDRSGRARFAVQSARLGPPGPGELRAAFAGEPGAAAAEARMAVERRTSVELSAVNAPEGRLAAGAPDEGAPLVVAAKARCAARGCSAVATGIVEVRSGDADDIVGAAPLDHGQARVVVTTAAVATEPLPLRIRYVPDAPWFEPAGELTVLLPVRPASGWRKGLLALAAAAAVAWVALVRLPLGPFAPFARRRASAARAARPGVSRGDSGARVELVGGAPGSGGWTGRVIDAHDGTAVGHASVSIERAGFERVDVVPRPPATRTAASPCRRRRSSAATSLSCAARFTRRCGVRFRPPESSRCGSSRASAPSSIDSSPGPAAAGRRSTPSRTLPPATCSAPRRRTRGRARSRAGRAPSRPRPTTRASSTRRGRPRWTRWRPQTTLTALGRDPYSRARCRGGPGSRPHDHRRHRRRADRRRRGDHALFPARQDSDAASIPRGGRPSSAAAAARAVAPRAAEGDRSQEGVGTPAAAAGAIVRFRHRAGGPRARSRGAQASSPAALASAEGPARRGGAAKGPGRHARRFRREAIGALSGQKGDRPLP